MSTTVSREKGRKGGKEEEKERFQGLFPPRDITVIRCLQKNVIKKVTVVTSGVKVSEW